MKHDFKGMLEKALTGYVFFAGDDEKDNSGPMIAVPYKDFMELTKNKLTTRQYFAGMALQGMELKTDGNFSQEDRKRGHPEKDAQWAATHAYRIADAMLKAGEE